MELRRVVRVVRRSREALQGYLLAKMDEEVSEATARHIVASYALLGLVEPGLDLRDLLLSVYLEQVAGYYEPDSTALFLVDDQPEEMLEPVLVHELVHALQDQHRSLDSLTAPERGNDARSAAMAAIEGHATVVATEWAMSRARGRDVKLEELPNFDALAEVALAEVASRYPRLAEAPTVVREALLYPYLKGAQFVVDVWRETEIRSSPLGPHLPVSTEQVFDPSRLLSFPADLPVRLAFERRAPVFQDNLGYLEMGVLLEAWGGDPASRAFSKGWAGDQYGLYRTDDAWTLRWVILWDDQASRDAFATWAAGAPAIPPGARIVPMELEGRPGTEVTVGRPPRSPVRIVATGRGIP